jgi:phosphonoacetaldehyde hydrolase
MGLMKRDHIRQISQMEPVARQWRAVHGRTPDESDVGHLYDDFIPLQLAILADYADPIPGAVELAADLRRRGIKIGSTTGYNREMMLVLTREAARRGYAPDEWVCATDVPAGRPYPWMMYANEMKLGAYPPEAVVKIGDTIPDIDEGLNAGAWAIGVAQTGNEIGLTEKQVAELAPGEFEQRLENVRRRMAAAGAHAVVDGVWGCAPVIEEIGQRLARGEKP